MRLSVKPGRAEITYWDDGVKLIDYVAIERDAESITFIMADKSRWLIKTKEVRSIHIPA